MVLNQYHFLSFPKEIQLEQIGRFKGICALYGYEAFLRLQNSHALVIGTGGVGSWIAESLVRTGIGEITLIDFDTIEISNSNRQLHTLSSTIGQEKAVTLGQRLLDINPHLKLNVFTTKLEPNNILCTLAQALKVSPHTLEQIVNEAKLEKLPDPHLLAQAKSASLYVEDIESLSNKLKKEVKILKKMGIANNIYVAEAIDDLFAKANCVDVLHKARIPLITSGGAGGRIDPGCLQFADVANAQGDQLIKNLRALLRRNYNYPKGTSEGKASARVKNINSPAFNILCSFSDEKPMLSKHRSSKDLSSLNLEHANAIQLPAFGASMTVTASAGLRMSSVIIRWIVGAQI